MHSLRTLILALACTAICAHAALNLDHPAFSNGWRLVERDALTAAADARQSHAVTLFLKQRNTDVLLRKFQEIADPRSPHYQDFMTPEQMGDLIAPHDADTRTVVNWLSDAGATELNTVRSRDVLVARLPRAAVEKLFAVTLHRIQHVSGRHIYRALTPFTLPGHIAPLVDVVKGVSDLPLPNSRRRHTVSRSTSPSSLSSPAPALRTADPGNNAPVVAAVKARGSILAIEFTPVCYDGSATTDPINPCSDHAPAIENMYITATPTTDAETGVWTSSSIDLGTCSLNSSNVVNCKVELNNGFIPKYRMVTVAVQSQYHNARGLGDSKASSPGFSPFPVFVGPSITPQALAAQYSVPAHYIVTNNQSTQCVVEFEEQYYSPADLALFFRDMGLPSAPVIEIGPNDPSNPGGEAALDIEYMMGLAPGSTTTFWSIKANSSVEIDDILSWSYAIGNATNPPLVNSLSYGMSSNQVDKYLGPGYLARSDIEFQKLHTYGLTIIIASGDTGCGDLGAPPMSNPTCDTFHPDWPSQSPYVTSVGATVATPQALPICFYPSSQGGIDCQANPIGEIAISLDQGGLYTGGGGFAAETATPDYQQAMVADYLNNSAQAGLLPPVAMFNPAGRGYPDVSAIGHNLIVALNGTYTPVDGTSASAPIFAAVITLINDVLFNHGKKQLGFLNYFLYQSAALRTDAFYDVTVGNNRCGAYGWDPLCCASGFSALPGWDAVTGLGTPNFRVLADMALEAASAK